VSAGGQGSAGTPPTILHAAPFRASGKRAAVHPVHDVNLLCIDLDALDQCPNDLAAISWCRALEPGFHKICKGLEMADHNAKFLYLLMLLYL